MKLKKNLLTLVATILVGALVAATYHFFENSVHGAITLLWTNLLHSEVTRLWVVPLCLGGSLVYFGAQHALDRKAEKHESQGLGEAPEATIRNFATILALGFLSLLAGASLGPEAILVPACIVVGAYLGKIFFNKDKKMSGLLGMLGFIALMAAFFNSFITGMLGLLLVTKQMKVKINRPLVILSVIVSLSTIGALRLLEGEAFLKIPAHVPSPTWVAPFAAIALVLVGYAITYALKITHNVFAKDFEFLKEGAWWWRALIAGAGLSALYLFGGPLVQFTGNQSIAPMLQQSAQLGLLGLFWIFVIKVLAISWSKALGYRGGLIFPSVFVASVPVAILQLHVSNLSFVIGLIAVMTGMLVADNKAKFLL